MDLENEETNLESERINSNSSSSRTFSSTNNKSQFHINPNPNRQYLSDVRNQPKDRFPKPLYDIPGKLNMMRDKQTESSGDEWRLLFPTKNLSIHSRDTKMLSNSRCVCFFIEEV
jgi:hypothetical protein